MQNKPDQDTTRISIFKLTEKGLAQNRQQAAEREDQAQENRARMQKLAPDFFNLCMDLRARGIAFKLTRFELLP